MAQMHDIIKSCIHCRAHKYPATYSNKEAAFDRVMADYGRGLEINFGLSKEAFATYLEDALEAIEQSEHEARYKETG